MISVRIARNYFIKLKKQTGITIQLANLLFSEQFDFGELVNNISLPAKEINAVLFSSFNTEDAIYPPVNISNPNSPDSNDFRAEIYKDTIKILEGRFEIRETSESEYNLDLFSGFQGLTFINKKISTLLSQLNPAVFGYSCDTSEELIQHAKDQNNDPNSKYFFPTIRNEFFYGDVNPDFKEILNRWDSINQTFYLNVTNVVQMRIIKYFNYDALSPQIKLHALLIEIFKYYNINLAGDFIDEIDTNKVLLYNNRSLDLTLSINAVQYGCNGASLGAGGGLFIMDIKEQDIYNNFDVGTGRMEILKTGRYIVKATMKIPGANPSTTYTGKVFIDSVEFYSKDITGYVFGDYNIDFRFVANTNMVGKFVSFSLTSDDGSVVNISFGSLLTIHIENTDGGFNDYANKIDMSNHVPNITLGELIIKLKKALGLHIEYDPIRGIININYIKQAIGVYPIQEFTNIASKKFVKRIIPPAVKSVSFLFPEDDDLSISVLDTIDLSLLVGSFDISDDLPIPTSNGNLAFIKNTSTIVQTIIEPINNDLVWSNKKFYYPKINYSEFGEEDVKLEVTPLMMTVDFDDSGAKSLKPIIAQQGSSPCFQLGENNNTNVRLLYWKGMVENSNHELHPLATSGSIDTLGNDIGTRELRLDGAKGLIENCWGKWFETLNIGIVWTRKFYFNILHMLNFNINKTFRCGNHSFMPKTGSINIESTSSVIEAEMDYIEVIP